MKAKILVLSLAGLAAMSLPAASFADQTGQDYVSNLFLSGGSNFAFRVWFSNQATLPSSCQGGFAYINVSNDNYQAYVSSLTSAYLAHKHVAIVFTNINGYCRIDEFGVYN